MVVELEVISQYPLPEVNNGNTTSRIPMRVFQNKMFVIEALQIEEHVNSKGLIKAKFATGKYDGEFYKLNTSYKTLRDLYFTPIVIKGLGK
jgi:hypothetical protein